MNKVYIVSGNVLNDNLVPTKFLSIKTSTKSKDMPMNRYFHLLDKVNSKLNKYSCTLKETDESLCASLGCI